MKIWDASIDFLTLVVRAETAEEAKTVAVTAAKEYGMDDRAHLCNPEELSPDGAAEVLVEDPSLRPLRRANLSLASRS
jgi:hypothetical protein